MLGSEEEENYLVEDDNDDDETNDVETSVKTKKTFHRGRRKVLCLQSLQSNFNFILPQYLEFLL